MCYSAQVIAEYRLYVRLYGADISFDEFVALYWMRTQDRAIKIPKAIDAWFSDPQTDQARQIKQHIDQFAGQEATRLERELFKQRKRLADAERKLKANPELKGAAEDLRIAPNKIKQITDEPPPEVAAAGHDRCIVPIKPEYLDAWLYPDPGKLADQYAILDDRERPYYEHRLAA